MVLELPSPTSMVSWIPEPVSVCCQETSELPKAQMLTVGDAESWPTVTQILILQILPLELLTERVQSYSTEWK